MSNELITIKQLPEIEQQLATIKNQIQEQTQAALALPCTEETVKEIKKIRADLKKSFDELEDKRKFVKNAILKPYNEFEDIYKDCVTNEFKPAYDKLTEQINEVEAQVKERKKAEIVEWFNEYLLSKNIDFVTFEHTGIVVKLSDSKKSLLQKAKDFVDKICDDLALIDTQEYKAEILVEYKKTLNASKAICEVTERIKAIEAEKQRAEEARKRAEAEAMAVQKVEAVAEAEAPTPITAPVSIPEEIPQPPISSTYDANPNTDTEAENTSDDELYRLEFSVVATRKKLSELKIFLNEGGYNYAAK